MKNIWQHTIIALSLAMCCQISKAEKPDASYVLGPGDVLSVTDDKGAETQATVLPDGTAVLNFAGVINAAGLTLDTVEEMVNKSAKKWTNTTQIKVKLAPKRAAQVYVLGAAKHPGLYHPPDSTAKTDDANAKHSFTVSDALEIAGGLTESADIRHIHVTRLHPKQVIDIDLWKLMHDGDATEDLVLQAGDVIYVPATGKLAPNLVATDSKIQSVEGKIRVQGIVRKPGLFTLDDDTKKVMSLITRAGGFTDPSIKHRIFVVHANRDGSVSTQRATVNQHGSVDPDLLLQRGDVVIVNLTNESLASERPTSHLGDFGPLTYPKWTKQGPDMRSR